MNDNKFGSGHYKDALQYTKEILRISSSIDEIMTNANIVEETKEEREERLREYK